MNYYFFFVLSCSIFVAAIIGTIKIRRVFPYYFPFFLCCCLACLNEIVSYLTGKWYHNDSVTNNIYVLAETLLITWQFYKWDNFGKQQWVFWLLLLGTLSVWCWEYHDGKSIQAIGLYFRLYAAFIIVMMSVKLNSQLIVHHRKPLISHPVFLICCGFILFFTFEILIETCWIYGMDIYPEFQSNIFHIMAWLNLFVNILYAIAFLCIPTKPRFITLY